MKMMGHPLGLNPLFNVDVIFIPVNIIISILYLYIIMEDLRLRFDELHLQLLHNHHNIHNEIIPFEAREDTGCLLGRIQTIASYLIENYNDQEIEEEYMFIMDEFIRKPSDNFRLNEFKLNTYKTYKKIHNNYKNFLKEYEKMRQTPTRLLVSRIKQQIDRYIESINKERKEINITQQIFKRNSEFDEYTNIIDIYIGKITEIFDGYINHIISNKNVEGQRGPNAKGPNVRGPNARRPNVRGQRTVRGPNVRSKTSSPPKKRANQQTFKPKPPSPPKTRTNAKVEEPKLDIKGRLKQLKKYTADKLRNIAQLPESEIKRVYDKIMVEYNRIVNKTEYLNAVDTPLFIEYVTILEDIEKNIDQFKRYLGSA
jgi:hypothetical protein